MSAGPTSKPAAAAAITANTPMVNGIHPGREGLAGV